MEATHDITERPRDSSGASPAHHDLFVNCPDACVVTDAKGIIADANQRAGEMLGLAPAKLRHKLLIAFVARGDTRAFRERLAAVGDLARSGDPIRVRFRARGGSPFDATLSVDASRHSPNDEPVSYLWTIHPLPFPSMPVV